ncbi:MAG: hypothetical protein JNJ58_08320 [Chitinophagaceae bacterium]|nr:hypothetical protein [Chitinophagaceae bacterium]
MNKTLETFIQAINTSTLSDARKEVLQPLIDYVRDKISSNETIRLNFICTHNSRRSHLGQIWAQTMAYYFNVPNLFAYSGGTEATALFSKVAETLTHQGFDLLILSQSENPIYAVKYAPNEAPVICFSKAYHHPFNPKSHFAAIVTCNAADEACPLVLGADRRIAIKYDDPKAFDGTELMDVKYAERSLEIAREMYYVFGSIK